MTTKMARRQMLDDPQKGARITDINSAIRTEQSNQIDKHPIRPATNLHWLAVTTEELAESLEEIRRIEDGVIRTILELGRRTQDVAESIDCRDREDAVTLLRKELVQAAACACSWIEWIDERYPDLSQDDQHSTIEVPVGLTDVDGDVIRKTNPGAC